MEPNLTDDILAILPRVPGARLGIAVSGGGDSVALLHAAHLACKSAGKSLYAASVNHGLRPEAADECLFVKDLCQNLNVSHDTLFWDGKAAQGNVQAAARNARYRLLSDWARGRDLHHVLLGHTADDQAETMLMALGRGAGPDGLAGMRPHVVHHGMTYLRPFLHVSREVLRAYLAQIGQTWIDDPSNDDTTYQRIRLRALLGPLADAGLPLAAFGQVAKNMTASATMLAAQTEALQRREVFADRGDYLMRADIWRANGPEQTRRLACKLICAVAGPDASPRRAEQREVLRRLRAGEAATIAGCRVSFGWGMVRFAREYRAVRDVRSPTDHIWDARWQVDGPHAPDLHVAALGSGLSNCPAWRATGLPAASLRATPAIWQGETLVAAPVAGLENGWTAQIVADCVTYSASH